MTFLDDSHHWQKKPVQKKVHLLHEQELKLLSDTLLERCKQTKKSSESYRDVAVVLESVKRKLIGKYICFV